MVRRQITRSICRLGPVVGTGLPVWSTLVASLTYEPQHYKTNKMTCAPSEDSDQPGHPPSQWVAEDPIFLHADSEDSGQTGRMSRLVWVFAGRRGHFVVLVVCGCVCLCVCVLYGTITLRFRHVHSIQHATSLFLHVSLPLWWFLIKQQRCFTEQRTRLATYHRPIH